MAMKAMKMKKGEMLFFVITSVVTSYLLIRGMMNLFSDDPITGITMLVLAVLLVFSTAKKKINY
jgi:hypothetical protein